MGPQVQLLQVKVDLRVMSVKRYSTLPRALELESHYQIQFSVMLRTPVFEMGFLSSAGDIVSTL